MGAGNSTGALPMSKTDFESFRGPRYTQETPNSRDASHGPTYFSNHFEVDESMQTLYHVFLRGWSLQDGARPCYGTRQVDPQTGKVGAYAWLTYDQVKRRVDAIASGLQPLAGLKRQECVGVFAKNRLEWCLAMHACDRMAYALVPLYDTLGPDAVPFIVNHTELRVLFCGQEQFHVVMDCAASCPSLKYIVQFEPVTSEQRHVALQHGLVLKSLDDIELMGRAEPLPADPPLPSDISTLCYTSGTTGDPKGVVLTHRNYATASIMGSTRLEVLETDVHLSYLPLPHVFERIMNASFVRSGAAIGFYQGDVLFLMEDMAELKPTVFTSVPRLFNRVFDKITQGVAAAGGLKKMLFDQAYAAKKADNVNKSHAFWDALVFGKMRLVLGGRVRLILSGSAPLSADVKEFMKIVFCCDVVEGYGLSETSAVLSLATGEMPMGAHVGPPVDNCLVRLEDVPEMNYTSNDKPRPRGEILVKGPNVFSGYYKAPDKTKEAIDEEGWFHTGDIGCWNADGTLSIIDRKKNIFKLSQGEYVAAEKVEGVYLKNKYLAQVFVYGDSYQSCLVAVAVPDPEVAEAWGAAHGLKGEHASVAQLVHNEAFIKDVLADMEHTAKAAELRGFEYVKKVHFHPDPFTMEAGLITPTFKLKRPQLKEYFLTQINHMYEELK